MRNLIILVVAFIVTILLGIWLGPKSYAAEPRTSGAAVLIIDGEFTAEAIANICSINGITSVTVNGEKYTCEPV